MSQDAQKPWYEWSEMTSLEIREALRAVKLALIPVGATEQHGPNLGTGTDYVVAHRIAQRIAQRMHPRGIVVPPLPFGLSPHHTGFPGTLTVSAEAFTALCLDVGRSLKGNGIEHVLFVNGHYGNVGVLAVLATQFHYDLGLKAAVSFYFQQAADRVKAHGKTPRYGHACEIETSVVMAVEPSLVRTEALVPGDMIEQSLQYAFNHQPFFHQVPIPFHQQTRNGCFGDARLATREIGEDILDTAIDRTLTFVDGFLK
ncbi:MAG: creatininase family protein [Betaproteobacteria bacterium]|nr:creatininase family protein [Betaproteobacteria bacterium]